MEIRSCQQLDQEAWNAVRPIYEDAFPGEGERKTDDQISRLMSKGRYRLHVASEGGIPTAFALVGKIDVDGHPLMLIDYIAVRSDLRSKGTGTRLVRWLVGTAEGFDGAILEVEVPHETNSLAVIAQVEKRQAFWKRQSFVLQDLTFEYRSIPDHRYSTMVYSAIDPAIRLTDGEAMRKTLRAFHKEGHPAEV